MTPSSCSHMVQELLKRFATSEANISLGHSFTGGNTGGIGYRVPPRSAEIDKLPMLHPTDRCCPHLNKHHGRSAATRGPESLAWGESCSCAELEHNVEMYGVQGIAPPRQEQKLERPAGLHAARVRDSYLAGSWAKLHRRPQ